MTPLDGANNVQAIQTMTHGVSLVLKPTHISPSINFNMVRQDVSFVLLLVMKIMKGDYNFTFTFSE